MELIVLCPNPFRDSDLALTRKAKTMLEENGYLTAVCPVFGLNEEGAIPSDIQISAWDDVANDAKMFIIIGGDGTILHTARSLDHSSKPLLGVNLGTKGFMAVLEPDELPLILEAAKGNYVSSRRMMVDIELRRNGEVIYSDCALNDVVIHGMGDCIKLTALCDGERIMSFSGDGIIVATPTGSTGYSLSAGGPIVEPEAENIIVSPICAHVIGAKCFVLGSEREIQVIAQKIHDRTALISVDGNKVTELINGDVLYVRKSRKTADFIHLGKYNFYDLTYEKLMYKNIREGAN